jgi:DNA-directed RNA polymerase subunit beta'
VDNLTGLKENVILGKLIPAGTGMKRYRNMHLTSDLVTPAPSMDPVEEDIELREQHELEEKNAKERDKKIKRIKEEDDDQKGVDLHAILEKLSEDVGDYADEDFDDSDLDDDDLDDLGEPNLDMLKDQDDSDE